MINDKVKKFFKSVEAISVIAAFIGIILTGAKIIAYLGLATYIVSNLKNGISTVVKVAKAVVKVAKESVKVAKSIVKFVKNIGKKKK